MPVEANIKKWDVTVLKLDRNKRHLDRAVLQVFWDVLDRSVWCSLGISTVFTQLDVCSSEYSSECSSECNSECSSECNRVVIICSLADSGPVPTHIQTAVSSIVGLC